MCLLVRAILVRLYSDEVLLREYKLAGAEIGHAISYEYAVGMPIEILEMLAVASLLEAEYARRGYRTVSVEDFVQLGGYSTPLPNFGQKLNLGESPVLHLERERQERAHIMAPET